MMSMMMALLLLMLMRTVMRRVRAMQTTCRMAMRFDVVMASIRPMMLMNMARRAHFVGGECLSAQRLPTPVPSHPCVAPGSCFQE